MDAERAKQLFKQADELYLNRQYQEALAILGQLNQAYPNQKNVLWPSALCMNKLGRHAEAIRLCDALIQYFNDDRAQDLKARAQTQMQAEAAASPPVPQDMLDGGVNLADLDAMIDRPPPPPRERPKAAPDYKKWALIGGGLAVIALLVVLPFFSGGSGRVAAPAGVEVSQAGRGDATSPGAQPFPGSEDLTPEQREALDRIGMGIGAGQTAGRAFIAICLLSVFLAQTIAMYCTFSIIGKLPSTDFSENAQDILLYSIIFTALSFVPIIGFIASLVIMSKHYQLSCGELAIAWIVIGVLTFGFVFVGAMIMGFAAASTIAVAT